MSQQQQLVQYAASCVQPGLNYFSECKVGSFKNTLACFKAAHFFLPDKVQEMRPSNSDIDTLEAFPFLRGCVDGLKSELPAYIAASEDVDPDYDPMDFW